jgi:AcrR family transcriptional regulator
MDSHAATEDRDKRATILRAATETIAEDGIGASTASLAKAATVAEGSLFRYFPDKLFGAAVTLSTSMKHLNVGNNHRGAFRIRARTPPKG